MRVLADSDAVFLVRGFQVELAPSRLLQAIELPALDSALLTYRFRFSPQPCTGMSIVSYRALRLTIELAAAFAPLLRVFSTTAEESHYFPDIASASLHLHSSGPFVRHKSPSGLKLQLWQDPQCDGIASIQLWVDPVASYWNMLFRYRLVLVSWSSAMLLLVLRRQLAEAQQTGQSAFLFSAVTCN